MTQLLPTKIGGLKLRTPHIQSVENFNKFIFSVRVMKLLALKS
jgi:hypothetical protein